MNIDQFRTRLVHIVPNGEKLFSALHNEYPHQGRVLLKAVCSELTHICEPDEVVSPEMHIFNFFKILYMCNVPITDNLVDMIWLYNFETVGCLTKCPKESWSLASRKTKFIPQELLECAILHTRLFWKVTRGMELPFKCIDLDEDLVDKTIMGAVLKSAAFRGKTHQFAPVGINGVLTFILAMKESGFEQDDNNYWFPKYHSIQQKERWSDL